MELYTKNLNNFFNNFIPATIYLHPVATLLANLQGMFESVLCAASVTFSLGLLRSSQMAFKHR